MTGRAELQWGSRAMMAVGGVGVHVESSVPQSPRPTRPHVALLHGFASGTFTWAGVAPQLADRWSLLAWDRPPFGRSERPRPARGPADPYRRTAEVARHQAVLHRRLPNDHIAGSGVVLVGHSAGTVAAIELALAALADDAVRGPRLRGLVLIAPALTSSPPALVRRLVGLPGVDLIGGAALRVAMMGAEPALNRMGGHRTPLIDATAKETAKLLRRRGTADALVHLTKTWEPADVMAELPTIGVPTLVLGGAEDRLVSPAQHAEVATALGGDLIMLDGVGHAAHEQVPDVVAGHIADFLDRR